MFEKLRPFQEIKQAEAERMKQFCKSIQEKVERDRRMELLAAEGFQLFPLLPCEVQREIWSHALNSRYKYNWGEKDGVCFLSCQYHTPSLVWQTFDEISNALLEVCRLSRLLVLEAWRKEVEVRELWDINYGGEQGGGERNAEEGKMEGCS